ncbi:MAG: hypothetical protein DRZ82_05330 [Thermoprotei archaeon]|nr:MAG: hypothetical protein DRZ82_05330 [Thermoprotei archaeon]
MKWTVCIIGGGPCGLLAARELALRDVNTIVFEEHDKIGEPVHCAGLVGMKCLRELRVPEREDIVLNVVYGIRLVLPSGSTILLKTGKPMGLVLDRAKFDQEIGIEAYNAGAEIMKGHRVVGIRLMERGVKVAVDFKGERKVVLARYVICAEGMTRRITRSVFKVPKGVLIGIQEEYELPMRIEDRYVTVFLGRRYSQGLFGWAIPTRYGFRIGTASYRDPMKGLNMIKATDLVKRMIRGGRIIRRMAGFVNTQGTLERFSDANDRIFLVGDSAGQNKPLSGGGIYYGGKGALILANEIVREEDIGRNYERKWNAIFGKEIRRMLILRNIMDKLEDREIDILFKTLFSKEEELEELSDYYDSHYMLIKRILPLRLFNIAKLIFKLGPRLITKLVI